MLTGLTAICGALLTSEKLSAEVSSARFPFNYSLSPKLQSCHKSIYLELDCAVNDNSSSMEMALGLRLEPIKLVYS